MHRESGGHLVVLLDRETNTQMAHRRARVPQPPFSIATHIGEQTDSDAFESGRGAQELARKLQADRRVPHGQAGVQSLSTVHRQHGSQQSAVTFHGHLAVWLG